MESPSQQAVARRHPDWRTFSRADPYVPVTTPALTRHPSLRQAQGRL